MPPPPAGVGTPVDGATPAPVIGTAWSLGDVLAVKLSVAARSPVPAGVNCVTIAHV